MNEPEALPRPEPTMTVTIRDFERLFRDQRSRDDVDRLAQTIREMDAEHAKTIRSVMTSACAIVISIMVGALVTGIMLAAAK